MSFGHMNRSGARHVGEPQVFVEGERRVACLYAAAMVEKHMPAFAHMAHEFEAVIRPPATIMLVRPGDPESAAITYDIPALLLPSSVFEMPKQGEFEDAS